MRNSRDEMGDRLLGMDLTVFTKKAMKKYNNRESILSARSMEELQKGSVKSSSLSDTMKRMASTTHIMTHGGVAR